MMSGPVPDWIAEVIRACRSLALMVSTFSVMPVAFWHSCVIWPLSRTSDAGTKSDQRSQCTVVSCAKAGARPLAKMAAKPPVRAATAPVAESLRSLRRVMRAMNSSLCVVRNPVAHTERGNVQQASRRDLPAKCFPDATPGRDYADLRRSTAPIHRHAAMQRCRLRVKLRRTRCEHMFSALPSNSDIARRIRHVSKVPNPDITISHPRLILRPHAPSG
jgi:hypothetical protein